MRLCYPAMVGEASGSCVTCDGAALRAGALIMEVLSVAIWNVTHSIEGKV